MLRLKRTASFFAAVASDFAASRALTPADERLEAGPHAAWPDQAGSGVLVSARI